jgi:hypothetical protein
MCEIDIVVLGRQEKAYKIGGKQDWKICFDMNDTIGNKRPYDNTL